MDKYECSSCGYIYDPEFGDEYHAIAPGTPFEELTADWNCPMGMRVCICQRASKAEARCGAPKSQFMRIT